MIKPTANRTCGKETQYVHKYCCGNVTLRNNVQFVLIDNGNLTFQRSLDKGKPAERNNAVWKQEVVKGNINKSDNLSTLTQPAIAHRWNIFT